MPLAVVGSNVVVEVNGRKVRGRQYPWGVAEGTFHLIVTYMNGIRTAPLLQNGARVYAQLSKYVISIPLQLESQERDSWKGGTGACWVLSLFSYIKGTVPVASTPVASHTPQNTLVSC